MPKSITISKTNSFFPEELEFKNLRTLGIQHIAELSGKLWTDHNTHDPGITILEVLCYALTDLAYRNNLDIKDILAQNPQEDNVENNFFRPAEILSCNPLTIDDYRKLLVDMEGVRNAWLIPATDAEVDFYVSCKNGESDFTFDKTERIETTDSQGVTTKTILDNKPVKLNGLYKVMLELEPYLTAGERDVICDINASSIGQVLDKVKQKLQAHRNLSEDFLDVNILKDECVGVNSSLELEPDADPEDVLVGIYNQLTDFFQPSISFYTLQEMLDKGKSMEDIFAGRPLTYESYGFVDMEELDALQRFEEVHASDIQREILKVKGVRAIRNLSLSSWIGEVNVRKGEQWCLPLTNPELYRPTFCPKKSAFCFFKGVMPFTIDVEEVNNRFTKRFSNFSKAKKSKKDLDFTVPQGQYREDLGDYYSIQNDFPAIYQVGKNQLPTKKGKRRSQALQLKSYLLFFDQLLANYLSQLATVRDNFSFIFNIQFQNLP